MTLKPVLVLALALLVPVLCMESKKRCELRDQLRASLFRGRIWENKLATVICEVEKFVNQSMMGPTSSPPTSAPSNSSTPAVNSTLAPTTTPSSSTSTSATTAAGSESSSEESSSEEDSSEERRGQGLQQCITMINGAKPNVDVACLRKMKVFVKIYLNAGEECKNADPATFFQDCPNSGPAKPNSSSSSSESDSDESKERPKFKPHWKLGWKSKPGKKFGR